MATVSIEGGQLVVALSRWEGFLAVHGSFRIPLENVQGATIEKPPGFWQTLKLIGTGMPWPLKLAGTFLYHGEVVFFDYQQDDNVLVIDLKPGASSYKHLFIHVDDPDTPDAAAARISAALAP
jgi:hypothetical protein